MKPHLLIFILLAILWSLSLYFYINPFLIDAAAWLKITIPLTIITAFKLLYLVIISKNSLKKFKILLVAAAVSGLVIILSLFINDFLGIEKYLASFIPEAAVFFLLFFVYASLGAAILFERILPGSTSNRLQTLYTLVAFAVFLIAITIVYVFLPLVAGLKEYLWLGPLFTAIFILFFILGNYLIKKTGEESEKKEEAERLVEEWKKLAEAKDQFLLSLQHHLRTPLTPFKIYLERILDGTYGREENPVIREKLIEMKQSINTLYSLIESLLDIQELKVGRKILEMENCQVENLIESIIEELKSQAEQKGLYLIFESTDQKELPALKVDKKRTREALWNLVDNAIKYTKKGGVTIRLEIGSGKLYSGDNRPELHPLSKERWLKIVVSDTGIGMARDEIENFLKGELFNRGEEAKKLYGPGRGIGLTIATEFIRAQNGRIEAKSDGLGKGTTFWIELPIK